MSKKRIAISKLGNTHAFEDKNNQDFVVSILNLKMVLDGCGSCLFSEIGTRLFAQFFLEEVKKFESTINSAKNIEKAELSIEKIQLTELSFFKMVDEVFARLTKISRSDDFYYQNFCFTILACLELENEYVVFACGDGYILKQTNAEVDFQKLDDGEYPKYYIYNYIHDKERLQEYRDGVEFSIYHFTKIEYSNVGVATDGIRFFEALEFIEKNRFQEYLKEGKKGKIGMLLNRNTIVFKDDISICF